MIEGTIQKNRLMLKIGGGLSYVALWQAAVFLILILLVWVNELLDLTYLIFGARQSPPDVMRGCVATAGVLVAGIVTVGNTYLQQRRIISGLLTICSYCKRIRIENEMWQRIEEFIGKRSPINFTHSVCPECFLRVKEMIEREDEDGNDAIPEMHVH